MKFIYYPDHDERYSHIPAFQRPEYPDEIVLGGVPNFVIKREKRWAELTPEECGALGAMCLEPCIAACDVPVSEALD